jgi:hypothetical protein
MDEAVCFSIVHEAAAEDFAQAYVEVSFDQGDATNAGDSRCARIFGDHQLGDLSQCGSVMPHRKQ